MTRRALLAGLAVTLAVGLAACGKKGKLEPVEPKPRETKSTKKTKG